VPPKSPLVLPSVLDRLLDDSNTPTQVGARGKTQQLLQLRNSVRRDLEALLNSHRFCRTLPERSEPLERSLLHYGAPDFFAVNAGSGAAREEFRRALEEAIRRFEPRFKHVTVKLVDDGVSTDRTLRFHIDALMYADPAPDPVSFDSLLDPASHSFSVVGATDG
jgi:type VI secretion system protein ImpF